MKGWRGSRPVESEVQAHQDRDGLRVEICMRLSDARGKKYWWVGTREEFAALVLAGVVGVAGEGVGRRK